MRAHLVAVGIIGPQEPFTVPSELFNALCHALLFRTDKFGLGPVAAMLADGRVVIRHVHVHAGNEDAFGNSRVIIGHRLEAFARRGGEAVEVQAVIPVCPADERQAMGTPVCSRIVEGAAQMLKQRLCKGGIVVKVHLLIQNAEIARFLYIGTDRADQPERIIIESAAYTHIAPLGQRLILVIGAAIRELRRGHIQNPLPCPVRNQMDEAQEILGTVPEAHAASDAALKIGSRTAHVERDHALILVPDVDLAVEPLIARVNLKGAQQLLPVSAEGLKTGIKLRLCGIFGQRFVGIRLVDDPRGHELFIHRALAVGQHEHKRFAVPRLQRQIEIVTSDGRPAVCLAVACLPCLDCFGMIETVIEAHKRFPVGIKAIHRTVDGKDRIVIAALTVLRLVINDRAIPLEFHLRQGIVALEVGAVIPGIPQTELNKGPQAHLFGFIAVIAQRQLCHLCPGIQRNHHRLFGAQTVFAAGDARIAQTVLTAILIQRRFDRLPSRIPDRVAVFNIEVFPAGIRRHIVVAIARQAQHQGIPIKGIAARGVADQRKEVIAPQIIDPRIRRIRPGNDECFRLIIKISVIHVFRLLSALDFLKRFR